MAEANNDKISEAVDATQAAVDKTAHAVSDVAANASGSVSDAIGSAAKSATKAEDATEHQVTTSLRRITDFCGDISDRTTGTIKKHPLRTVVIAAACASVVGFLAGAIFSKRS